MNIELSPSENARYARAELEVIASGLRVAELAELVAHARVLLDRDSLSHSSSSGEGGWLPSSQQ